MAKNQKQYQEFIIDGQPVHAPLGVSELEVRRFMQKEKQPKQTASHLKAPDIAKLLPTKMTNVDLPESFARGFGRSAAKSVAGLGEFITGKPINLPEEPKDLTIGQRIGRGFGAATEELGKTALGFTAGSKLGAPFGMPGRAAGALLGSIGAHYLTQPGPRLGAERGLAAVKGAGYALGYGLGHPERREIEQGIAQAEKNIQPYEAALKNLQTGKTAAETALKQEKRLSKKEIGISDLGSLEYQKKLAQEEMPRAQQKIQQIEAKENLKEIFKPEEDRTHAVNIHKIMKQKLEEKQKSLGGLYTKFKEKHSGKQIETGVQKTAQQIIDELPKPTSSELFGMGAKSAEQLGHEVDAKIVPITKDINSVFDNWRSLKRYAQRARGKARAAGEDLSPDEKNNLISQANSYEQAATKLEQLIAENDKRANTNYGQSLEELKGINQRYSNEYAPIYDTNVFWNMRKQGKAPPNFIETIEGLHPGKEILRNIVKSDEKLLKSSLGQMLEKEPESALEIGKNTLLNPYLAEHKPSQEWYKKLKTSMGYMTPEQKQQFGLVQQALKIQEAAKSARTPQELKSVIKNADEYIARLEKAENNLEKINESIKTTEEQKISNEKLIKQLQDQRKKLSILKTGLAPAALKYGAKKIKKIISLGRKMIT